jgi:hypothetical protein
MRATRLRIGSFGGVAAAMLAAPLVGGCASGPGELQRLRVENELLREELRIVRSNCSYYRDVEMEVEEEPAPGAR